MHIDAANPHRRTVLIFAGNDPSGGAGMTADVSAVQAVGAHPLSVLTTLTVQDNNRVYANHPVSADVVRSQAAALMDTMQIDAVKIGAMGSVENGLMIVELIQQLRQSRRNIPVVLDTVLASGRGDALSSESLDEVWAALYPLVTVITPNLMEAEYLSGKAAADAQAAWFLAQGAGYALIKGGHGVEPKTVCNVGLAHNGALSEWRTERLAGEFHGTGCTLAAAIAAHLALGFSSAESVERGQKYCFQTLLFAYSIAAGQRIPERVLPTLRLP